MRLARKITLALELGILTLVVVYAYTEISDDARTIRADVRSDLTAVAHESTALLATLDPEVARDALRKSADPASPVQVRWLEDGPVEAVVETGDRMLVYRAFTDSRGQRAVLELSRSTDDIDRLVRAATIRSIILVAVIIVLGTLYSISIGARIVARPMRRLVERFRRVGAGDLSRIAGPRRRDELGVIENELDEMIGRLAESRDSLVAAHAARLDTLAQLQHAERLTTVGKLASGIAHELGTPLNVISGYARLIASKQDTGDAAAENARIIDEQAQRITNIVRQLLDFARRGKPKLATGDLRATTSRAIALAAVLAKKSNVRLAYVEPDEPMLAELDDGRMQQVIVNLVHNAIQASPGGAEVAIRLARAERDGRRCLVVEVVDHGAGIAADDVPRVFEPFFTTKAVGEGTGLGLSVSYGIMQEHDGGIDVTSELGAGSRFSAYLPEHVA